MNRQTLRLMPLLLLAALVLSGCSSMYYNAMESLGRPKRDILVSRVKEAREDQQAAQEQFASAFDQFKAVVNFDGGNLEREYNRLNSEYERCETRADAVRERVDSIESVANALFREWESELKQYSSPELRRSSERTLAETRARYDELILAMRNVETRMDPVLAVFRDQVLFLKHNLNARAIASLEGELGTLERDVTALLAEMQASIDTANAFIERLETE